VTSPSPTVGGIATGVANHLSDGWVADGLISGSEKGAIQSAAAKNN
jgi:hypothetical protein